MDGSVIAAVLALVVAAASNMLEEDESHPTLNQPDMKASEPFYNTTYFKTPVDQQPNVIAASCNCKSKMRIRTLMLLKHCIKTVENYMKLQFTSSQLNMALSDRIILCSCTDDANELLKKSLKDCNEALDVMKNCNSKLPDSCLEVKRRNPQSTSGYYFLVVNYEKFLIYCYMEPLC